MQKTVLLINKGKSFMVVTIAKSFTDAGYKLEEKDRKKLQLLQEAAQVPDWERLKELIK